MPLVLLLIVDDMGDFESEPRPSALNILYIPHT
jgi:hypothetical protein